MPLAAVLAGTGVGRCGRCQHRAGGEAWSLASASVLAGCCCAHFREGSSHDLAAAWPRSRARQQSPAEMLPSAWPLVRTLLLTAQVCRRGQGK